MILYEIKNELRNGKRIYDLKLKVAYYARVSTDKYDQINSLTNQVNYYDELIRSNDNWEYGGSYIDEGISGTSTKNRDGFNKMIKDAKMHKFNLIITKEISRFARDTLDSIQYTRKLLEEGIGVYFQSDNILTFEDESELKLTIMSSIAQEEVRKLSERTKFGFQRSIEAGRVMGNDYIWGYRKDKCKLVIVEEEAKMIQLIFDMYVNGNIGMRTIGFKLASLGYLSKTNKPLSQSTIKSILSNPKYKGYYCGNKTRVINYHTKKRININKEDWKLYKDENIPQIVSEYTWNKAQKILNKRSTNIMDKRVYQNRYIFSGKILCMEHNTTYRRHKQTSGGILRKSIITWRCKNFLLYNDCNGPILYDEALQDMVLRIILKHIDTDSIIDDLLDEYKKNSNNNDLIKSIKRKKMELEKLNKYKNTLFDLLKESSIVADDFKIKIDEAQKIIESINEEINNMSILLSNQRLRDIKLKELKNKIYNKTKLENINKEEMIRQFLDFIEVKEGTNELFNIDVILNIGRYETVFYNSKKHTFYSNDTYD